MPLLHVLLRSTSRSLSSTLYEPRMVEVVVEDQREDGNANVRETDHAELWYPAMNGATRGVSLARESLWLDQTVRSAVRL